MIPQPAEPEDAAYRREAEPRSAKRPGKAEPQLRSKYRGWYRHNKLPHFDEKYRIQSVTFRLADSLPKCELVKLEESLKLLPAERFEIEQRKRIESFLDAGHGCCALKHDAIAETIQKTFTRFHGSKYGLLAWCIMPNHVHVLIRQINPLPSIVQSWKSYTGKWALRYLAEQGLRSPSGDTFWQPNYWDRYIRNENHFQKTLEYIHENPVKAGLCSKPEEWRWSSACQWTSRNSLEC